MNLEKYFMYCILNIKMLLVIKDIHEILILMLRFLVIRNEIFRIILTIFESRKAKWIQKTFDFWTKWWFKNHAWGYYFKLKQNIVYYISFSVPWIRVICNLPALWTGICMISKFVIYLCFLGIICDLGH